MFQSQVKTPDLMLTVSDLKQFVYCPRIPYFCYVMPVPTKQTFHMATGEDAHRRLSKLERRRTTHKYSLREGAKLYKQAFRSERLGLSGLLDLLIETNSGFYPVEYKNSIGEPQLHHRYQLTAYALLVEESNDAVVRSGYLCMLRSDDVFPLEITESKKLYVKNLLDRMRRMIETQTLPAPTPHRGRCDNCEFRLYCADTV
ncbi:MAG: CRISPR-associated protein Cas4 [Candidatus Obscuribacterales bacterium]|nr:CRISPR-associated protein Cas4 [Candidatus Obscuribacterales bacterium]